MGAIKGNSLVLWREPTKQFVQLVFLHCLIYVGQISSSHHTIPEDSCAAYDTCKVRDFFRTCNCDNDCSRYDTCCEDAPLKDAFPAEDFQCHADSVPQPIFIKRSCSSAFVVDPDIKASCESYVTDRSDLMASVLVSSNRTWTTYRNWNCAICNGERARDLWFWTIQASYNIRAAKKRLDVGQFRRSFMYDSDSKKWGVYGDDGQFIPCPLQFYQPVPLIGQLRYCAGEVMSTCLPDWEDLDVKKKCSAYYGERKLKHTALYFRNVHCAMCNGLQRSDMECFGRNYRAPTPEGDILTMRVIFNLNAWTGEHIRGQSSCPRGQRYDPFTKSCRSISCGLKDPSLTELCDDSGSKSIYTHSILCLFSLFTTLALRYV